MVNPAKANSRRADAAPADFADSDARWRAVVERDASANGRFYYSVSTTGVYCHPSCGSRLARREHVAFHDSRAAAERAGFRPCKRCKPDREQLQQQQARLIAAACRQIEAAEQPPGLNALADSAGLSPYHFHRLFKKLTGVTPKAYAQAQRAQRLRAELPRSESVTDAMYEAGFNSSGRFYAQSAQLLGMQPRAFRRGATAQRIRFALGQCSLGAILVAATERGVCAILLGDDADLLLRDLQDRFDGAELIGADAEFENWMAKVIGLIELPNSAVDLPLDIRGSAFQQRVWQALCAIPPGSTASYAEIARKLGLPKAARAVAQACAANALAVAIPCHRVVRSDGALSGYRWGVERKRELLQREGAL